MAIAIKSIPVLTGDTAKRFVAMADSNKRNTVTSIPESMRQSILRMKERSSKFQLKKPQ